MDWEKIDDGLKLRLGEFFTCYIRRHGTNTAVPYYILSGFVNDFFHPEYSHQIYSVVHETQDGCKSNTVAMLTRYRDVLSKYLETCNENPTQPRE